MAATQSLVDNAVSQTLRFAENASAHDLATCLLRSWELGLKDCTAYREGSRGGATVASAR